MHHSRIILGLLISLTTCTQASSFRKDVKKGLKNYRHGEQTNAIAYFSSALEKASTNNPEEAVYIEYNLATALQATGQLDEALPHYEAAMHAESLELQHHARYNSGNIGIQQAHDLEAASELEPALAKAENAIQLFEEALQLQPHDTQAKKNYELAYNKSLTLKEKIKEQKQEQQENEDSEDQEQKNQDKQDSSDQPESNDQEKEQKEDEKKDNDPKEQNKENEEKEEKDPSEQQPQPQEGKEPKELTPEEAKMILDAMREEEQANREETRIRLGRPVPVEKNW